MPTRDRDNRQPETVIAGPLSLRRSPQTLKEAQRALAIAHSQRHQLDAPIAVAGLFLQTLLLRDHDRAKALAAMTALLHPACLVSQETLRGAVPQIRKHPQRQLNRIESYIAASFVRGTSPKLGYRFDPDCFELAVGSVNGGWAVDEGAEAEVELFTTGAPPTHPTSRMLRLKRHGGQWLVRAFDQLAMPTIEPSLSAAGRRSSVQDYVVPLPTTAHRSEGLQRVDIEATRRRIQRSNRESNSARLARQRSARDETSTLASKLTATEINRRCVADPREREIITVQGGRISRKLLHKGELFEPAVGIDAIHVETAGEAADHAKWLVEQEELRKRDELRRRISETLKKVQQVAVSSVHATRVLERLEASG